MARFFWQVILAGIVILIAVRVATALDRMPDLSPAVKWAILVGVTLAAALFLSLVTVRVT